MRDRIAHQVPSDAGADVRRLDVDRVQLGDAVPLRRAQIGEADDRLAERGHGEPVRVALPSPYDDVRER
jgi:hypothetical protein